MERAFSRVMLGDTLVAEEWDSDLATNYLQFGVHSHNAYHSYRSKVTLLEDHLAMYGNTPSPMNMTGVA